MKVFPSESLLLTEFKKVIELVSEKCLCPLGKKAAAEIQIYDDFEKITALLHQTNDFKKIFDNGENFPSQDYLDIRKELQLLGIENSVLASEQFMNLLSFSRTLQAIINFLKNRQPLYPHLASLCDVIVFEKKVMEEIETVFEETGIVRNTASPELASIRRNLNRRRSEAERIFVSVLQKLGKKGVLSETNESSRNGRRVVAIVSESKRMINGIVHDISATGKTTFIEPQETIEINNAVVNLENEERLEIHRILKELTSSLRRFHSQLKQQTELLSVIDFTRAKALFAIASNSHLPYFINQSLFDFKNARHPILFLHNKQSAKPTVPFSLRLDDKRRILVISGPNAGGKTVCLKTIGLLQMMLQSGLLVSTDENSTMGIFKNLMVDIGDSQSIEYELSTYSSRLKHMKIFIERASAASLFLIDEFGSGTDPELGGALAEAVLEELNSKKTIGIITTHYMNLKVLADKTQGIINGSMLFDSKNLKPLYQLQVGKPGSSYTFVVAERSGLSRSLVQNARNKVSKKHVLLEQLLTKVEQEKSLINKRLSEIGEKEKKLTELLKKNENMILQNEKDKDNFEQRLSQHEQRVVSQWEANIKRFTKEWKETKNKKYAVDKLMGQLQNRKNNLEPKKEDRQVDPNIKVGVKVRLHNGKTNGVVKKINGNKAQVQFGNFMTNCDLANLVIIEDKK